jgi:mRNA-degrading endonuclease toxin of MazEF toxin-antitoxin module
VKPFEIFSWRPPGWPDAHPCVIVSHPDRADRKTPVEVLMCSTKRATRHAEPHEILLDKEDGLDWPTLCKCDLIHAVSRTELKGKRGSVSPLRRPQLVRTLLAAHGWTSIF